MSEQMARGKWRLTLRGKELFSKPRVGVLRSITLNHWYHHRVNCRSTSVYSKSRFR